MGDRVLIQLKDSDGAVSPVCYLHWHGGRAPDLIRETAKLMQSRGEDIAYAFARLVGVCHQHIEGNTSLGVWPLDGDAEQLSPEQSHGDAGIYIVHCGTWEVEAFGGYGESFSVSGKPSWDDAPEWAHFLAQDENGKWFWHEVKPYIEGSAWAMISPNGERQELASRGVALGKWDETLEVRPIRESTMIAAGLECTALGTAFVEKALDKALAMPGLSQEYREAVERHKSKEHRPVDYFVMFELANKIRTGEHLGG